MQYSIPHYGQYFPYKGLIFVVCLLLSASLLHGQSNAEFIALSIQAVEMESINRDSAIAYWTKQYKKEDVALIDKAHYALTLSKTYNTPRNCELISQWNKIAEDLYLQAKDQRGSAEVAYQKGYYFFCINDNEEALSYFLSGLKIMHDLNDEYGMALGHLRISRIFHFTSKMLQSAEYGVKAGARYQEYEDYIHAWDSWSFAGHGYRMGQDSIQALTAFNKGLEAAKQSNIPSIIGNAYNDLATFHMENNDYDKAEEYFLKCLELINPDEERQIMVVQNGLSQVYLHTKRYEECISVSTEAMAIVRKTNDLFFFTELPEYIAKAYEGIQQYDSAYKYMKLNWEYSEDMFTKNQDSNLEEMTVKYETQQKELLINKQRKEQYFSIGLIGILSLIGLTLWQRYQSNVRLSDVLVAKNEQKDYLMKEIHHRVKNNLQILSSLLSLQSDSEPDEHISEALQESRNRVQSMGLIHQRLYANDNISIDIKEYINELCVHLQNSYGDRKGGLLISNTVDAPLLDVDSAIPLGLIINELITNSIKYATTEGKQGIIDVSLQEENGAELILQVKDNGTMDHSVEDSSSSQFGTSLVEILSKKLKGSINISKEEGYSTTIQFKRYKTA